jgi:hypothetical protein|tara:strand:- start:3073 stop:4623 length:1551 start_codon:yes stop_codon:yes gene_type:complete
MKKHILFVALLLVSSMVLAGSKGNPTVWPDWSLATVGGIQEKAYPALNYETRIGVIGGRYPYDFSITTGPSGLTVDPRTGVVSWSVPITGSYSVSILIVDSSSKQISYDYVLNVTTNGFYFVSPSGLAANNGSIGSPWPGISHAVSNTNSSDVVYLRGGDYSANNISINSGSASMWLAYPSEAPRLNVAGTPITVTAQSGEFTLFSGLDVFNCGNRCFFLEQSRNVTFYKNRLRDLNSSCAGCNPSFLYFSGHNTSAARHDMIKVMNNTFSELSANSASETDGAVVAFDVHNSLFEDNELRAMGNYGFADKDNTYRNTYRGNYIEGTHNGIGLKGQSGSNNIHVHHNLVSGAQGMPICEYGPCTDFYIHHNTIIDGNIVFRGGVSNSNSGNINFAYNVFTSVSSSAAFWSTDPVAFASVLTGTKLNANHNIIEADTSRIAGNYWGGARYISQNEWTSSGHDTASLFTSPNLQGSGISTGLSPSSQYYGIYGHQLTEGGPSALPSTPAGFTAIIKRD